MTEQEERQARNERRLRRVGAKVNRHLPLLESESNASLREPSEVANRVLCLVLVSAWASGELDNDALRKWAIRESFWQHFSPDERAFLSAKKPDRKDTIWMGWQIEAALALVWAITPEFASASTSGSEGPGRF